MRHKAGNTPREIECKLDVAPEEADALRARLVERLGPPAGVKRLSGVYFDTEAQDLRKAAISLRVRRIDGGETFVQTVKRAATASSGLFDRDEWEQPVPGPHPDLSAVAATPAGAVLNGARTPVGPVFETDVERTTWEVRRPSGAIEVAFDTGRVAGAGKSVPLFELELEAKEGDVGGLLDLMAEITRDVPLRVGVLTKSERGYALSGKAGKPVKAEPLTLTETMTAAEAFRAIIHSTIRQFRRNEALVAATRNPEGLHQARVGMRRLRAALSLFKPVVADRDFEGIRKRLQAASQELGEARNLDVYLQRVVEPEAARNPGEPGVGALLAEVQARREASYDGLLRTLNGAAFRHLMLDLLVWIEAGPWCTQDDALLRAAREQPLPAFAAAALEKRWRQVCRKGRKIDKLDPEERHRVRIAAKKLRYAAEFTGALAGGVKEQDRRDAFLSTLESLQEDLGDLNDIATGHELAESLARDASASSRAAAALFAAGHGSGQDDARIEALLVSARRHHDALTEAKRFWSRWGDD